MVKFIKNSKCVWSGNTTITNREEEPLNRHETPGRQIKQSNQLFFPIKMIAIQEWT